MKMAGWEVKGMGTETTGPYLSWRSRRTGSMPEASLKSHMKWPRMGTLVGPGGRGELSFEEGLEEKRVDLRRRVMKMEMRMRSQISMMC